MFEKTLIVGAMVAGLAFLLGMSGQMLVLMLISPIYWFLVMCGTALIVDGD